MMYLQYHSGFVGGPEIVFQMIKKHFRVSLLKRDTVP